MVLEPVNDLTTEFDLYNILITKEVGTLTGRPAYPPAGYAQFSNFHYNSGGELSHGPQLPGQRIAATSTPEPEHRLGAHQRRGHRGGLQGQRRSLGRFNFELQSTWVH